jgi:hypothetical protein
MSLLSLGLNLDEPQAASGIADETPRIEESPSPEAQDQLKSLEQRKSGPLGRGPEPHAPLPGGAGRAWAPVSTQPVTPQPTNPTVSPVLKQDTNGNGSVPKDPGVEESSSENWSDTGLQIIQSVLRQAEKKTAAPENGRAAILRQGSGQASVPPNAALHSEQSPALPNLEELRKIAEGMAPIPAPGSDLEGKGVTARSAADAPSSALAEAVATPLHEASPRIGSPTSTLEPAKTSETPTPKANLSASSAPLEIEPENRAPVSSLAPEFLSPVMEELRLKLASEISNETHGNVSVLARLGAHSSQRAWAPAATQSQNKREPVPTFATFKFGNLPARGLLYSFIGHEVAMFAIFLFITYVIPNIREQRLLVGSLNPQDHIIYLPEVGGGTQGEKSAGGGTSKAQQASAAPARASKGFAYPGAQSILSNPPNPTNAFQTVLHPLAVHPEALKKLVPLPNIVQMAETRLPTDLIARKAAMPHYEAPVQPIKVRQDNNFRHNAKWDVPVKAPQLVAKADMPKLAAAQQPLPAAPKVEPKPVQPKAEQKPAPAPIKVRGEKEKQADKSEKQAAPPSTAQLARLEMHGKSSEPLLSLSPAPLPTQAKVPAGEARGRFAIAPGGKLNPNSVAPGKPNGTPSESPATGQEGSKAANATSELASNAGAGTGHNPEAGGGTGNSKSASGGGAAGAGSGSGNTVGAGVAAIGNGNGRGSAGTGAGRAGRGAGTGAGAGSGAGTGSFPGITIQGGEGNEGNSEAHSFTVVPQTPYQMTIVATASSGGGLADYGVFENERVYTVYVPMQRTPQEADPTWTLQYALEDSKADSGGQLIAPTPVMREWPQIPADLEKAYSQQQVVVSAILGTDGKLTHFSVKQSPDSHLSAPITQALAKWVFRPAQQDNKPVPVKILLGIPLN